MRTCSGVPRPAVVECARGEVWRDGPVVVTAASTDHAPVRPTVGYRVDEGDLSVVLAGDTIPCTGLDELCTGADVLVHTVVRRDLIEPIGLPRLTDVLDYHSTVEDAARTAARAGVGTLVLTHLVPAPAPDAEEEWAALAHRHFGGTVVVARDLVTHDAAAAAAR